MESLATKKANLDLVINKIRNAVLAAQKRLNAPPNQPKDEDQPQPTPPKDEDQPEVLSLTRYQLIQVGRSLREKCVDVELFDMGWRHFMFEVWVNENGLDRQFQEYHPYFIHHDYRLRENLRLKMKALLSVDGPFCGARFSDATNYKKVMDMWKDVYWEMQAEADEPTKKRLAIDFGDKDCIESYMRKGEISGEPVTIADIQREYELRNKDLFFQWTNMWCFLGSTPPKLCPMKALSAQLDVWKDHLWWHTYQRRKRGIQWPLYHVVPPSDEPLDELPGVRDLAEVSMVE